MLVRIDRAGRWIAAALPVAPSGPPVAASGAIWVPCCWVVESEHASLPLEGWLLRVDPATNQVDISFSPLESPAALLASDASPPSVLADHGAVFMK